MALGYAMAGGRPSAYGRRAGPGFNTNGGAVDRLCGERAGAGVIGQIQQAMIGRNVGCCERATDQLAIMRGLTKWADRINAPRLAEAPGWSIGIPPDAVRPPPPGRPLECALDIWGRGWSN